MNVLLLGGTSEATALAEAMARRRSLKPVISLAGRTSSPAIQPIPMRVGGFGGVEGLAAYLKEHQVDVLIDATHPFAEQMSRHADAAALEVGVPLCVLTRAPWTPISGDNWLMVDSIADAASALGDRPRRVLLTVGRLGLAAFEAHPQHDYIIRTIDPPGDLTLPRFKVIQDRPPFDVEAEEGLMRKFRVDILVTKNSGGKATSGKLVAARNLGVPVIMVNRPPRPEVETFTKPADVMIWLARQKSRLAALAAPEVAD